MMYDMVARGAPIFGMADGLMGPVGGGQVWNSGIKGNDV
jgi:hypothetical protein